MNFFVFLPKTSKISEFRKTHFKAQFDSIQFIWKLQQFQHIQVFLHPWLSQISLANHSTQTGLHSLHQLLRVPAESSIYILFQHSAAGTLSDSLGNVCEKLRHFRDRKHHNLQDLFFFFFLGISLVQASFSRVLSSSRQNKQPSVPVRWLAHRVRGCGISYG